MLVLAAELVAAFEAVVSASGVLAAASAVLSGAAVAVSLWGEAEAPVSAVDGTSCACGDCQAGRETSRAAMLAASRRGWLRFMVHPLIVDVRLRERPCG